ncbi:MAG TPA: lipoyl(octanoyl) transferase LipB [Thermoanaerobaculia bacterium]
MQSRRSLHWDFLGRVPYDEAVALQHAVREALKRGEGPERFLLLEHPPVFTLGRNASHADILADPDWLAARGVQVAECDRGGQVTYHGPGQLVGYPVVNLSPDRRDIRRYVRDLQEVLIRTLADYGVAARPGEEQAFIGVWAGEEKIASIGVHLSRWITTHGFALNVSTDLSFFNGIIPCGLHQVRMTSIERLLGEAPSLPEIAAVCARHFGDIFDRELVTLPAPAMAAEVAPA